MKNDTILILAAAGIGLFLVAKMTKPAAAASKPATNASGTAGTQVVLNTSLPGDPGWGWTYYTDGTAIGPDGTYYLNGQKVWSAL